MHVNILLTKSLVNVTTHNKPVACKAMGMQLFLIVVTSWLDIADAQKHVRKNNDNQNLYCYYIKLHSLICKQNYKLQ